MLEAKEQIVASHLTTKEDFSDFKLAASKAATNKKEVITLSVLSYVMILFGLIGGVFFSKGFFKAYTNGNEFFLTNQSGIIYQISVLYCQWH